MKRSFSALALSALLTLCVASTIFLNVRPLLDQRTVAYVDDQATIGMNWDNGFSLSLMPSLDSFSKEPELVCTASLVLGCISSLHIRRHYF